MTNASHQPSSMTDAIGEMLESIASRRDHVAIDFEPAENGCMEETHDSLKRRIARTWGFSIGSIVLQEGSMMQCFEMGGVQFNVYDAVQFSAAGKGWSTDFGSIVRDSAYDD